LACAREDATLLDDDAATGKIINECCLGAYVEPACCSDSDSPCVEAADIEACVGWEPDCCAGGACDAASQDEANCLAYEIPECCSSCGQAACTDDDGLCPSNMYGADDYACCAIVPDMYVDQRTLCVDTYYPENCATATASAAEAALCDEMDPGFDNYYGVVMALDSDNADAPMMGRCVDIPECDSSDFWYDISKERCLPMDICTQLTLTETIEGVNGGAEGDNTYWAEYDHRINQCVRMQNTCDQSSDLKYNLFGRCVADCADWQAEGWDEEFDG
jgi:hypothetical protein